jgi:hypothetical protein
MPGVWLITVVACSLVPYKAWSRDLFGSEGFNLGDLLLVLVLVPPALHAVRNMRKDSLWLAIVVLWGTAICSLCKGALLGEDFREMMRIMRAVVIWAAVPLMVLKIRDLEVLHRWQIGMAVLMIVASCSIVFFSYYPSAIPSNDEMATIREESYEGVERVFTSGMWGVFTGAVLVVSMLLVGVRHKTGVLLLAAVLLVGLLHTFVRTYLVLLAIALGILLWRSWRAASRKLAIPLAIAILLFLVLGLPDSMVNLVQGTVTRMSGMFVADFAELDATDSNAYGTVIWRVIEVEGALGNLKTVSDMIFGVMGRPYTLATTDVSTVPHISYFGIFYINGFVGIVAYAFALTLITRRLWRNHKEMRGKPLSWATQGALITWITLLLGCLMAPLLQFAYGVVCFALIVGLSESAYRLSLPESATANEFPQNNGRDPELQLGALH